MSSKTTLEQTCPRKIAVMCGGMGSIWPGMGRELYDTFPVARKAMDLIQSVADWDVLSLMDEKNFEKINATRWQIPYLFLLEYAQWCCLKSLGFQPDLLCGHSLGELIALCCAGVYAPDVAWYILDTRAKHVAELEARSGHEISMMAVHANKSVIEEVRTIQNGIYIANYNTHNQFILCGSREVLREARNTLRKRHIPAIMLNVSLMFHSPGMRVLRDLSLRRLNALEMHAPDPVVISVAKAQPYPSEQQKICQFIADLDENPVLWLDTVETLWQRYDIREYLELGPQEILCGLVRDIKAEALCLACGRKGKERESMLQVCTQLFSLGHLTSAHLASSAQIYVQTSHNDLHNEDLADVQEALDVILAVLAKASGRPVESLRMDQDLRYDLALRSISFPLLLNEAEEKLGISVDFDDLVQVSTVGDLVRVLTGKISGATAETLTVKKHLRRPPLWSYAFVDGKIQPLSFDPCGQGLQVHKGDTVAFFCDGGINPKEFLNGLVTLNLQEADFAQNVAGLFFIFQPEKISERAYIELVRKYVARYKHTLRYLCCLRLWPATKDKPGSLLVQDSALLIELAQLEEQLKLNWLCIEFVCNEQGRTCCEYGDMLAREIYCGSKQHVLWTNKVPCSESHTPQIFPFRTREHFLPLVFSEQSPVQKLDSGFLRSACQFSTFADASLTAHGSKPDLPLSYALQAMLEGAFVLMPWLDLIGLSDLRFQTLPTLHAGITRECQVEVQARTWLQHDHIQTRLCSSTLTVRDLTANGRHTDLYLPVAQGTILLAAEQHRPLPIWPLTGGCKHSGEKNMVSLLYQSLSLGQEWQLLETFQCLPDKSYLAKLGQWTRQSTVQSTKDYNKFLQMVEAIVQAAYLAIILEDNCRLNWHLNAAGFILFGQDSGVAPYFLQLACSWADSILRRFDAQVSDAQGKVLLTLYHLEFNLLC